MNHKQQVSRSKQLVIHWVDAQGCAQSTAVSDYGSGRKCLSTLLFHFGQTHKVTRLEELDCVHAVVGTEDITDAYLMDVHRWDHKFTEITAHNASGVVEIRHIKSPEGVLQAKQELEQKHGPDVVLVASRPPELSHDELVQRYCGGVQWGEQ